MASIIQKPTPPNAWLYKDINENERWFTDEVCRPDNSEPWMECTQSEREDWEEDHPQPESETESETESEPNG